MIDTASVLLHTRILLGFAVGVVAGGVVYVALGPDHPAVVFAAGSVAEPIG